VRWRRYTLPPAERAGSWPNGAAKYAPAGAGVWSSPAIDPVSRTVFYGTGNSFTGTSGDNDSVIALDVDTGALRWKQQITHPDDWTLRCIRPTVEHCAGMADDTNLDWDFGPSPNVFTVGGRTLVGIGQKSGFYHAFDATTGQIVWQRQVSVAQHNGGSMGILWGTASDGRRLYVATWLGKPGTLFGLNPATGEILWRTPNPADGCITGGAAAHSDVCTVANMAAVTATPGLVYEGGMDGKMRIYRAEDGAILWQYDTVREFTGANHVTGPGGAIAGHGGAVVAHGMLYVQSEYYSWFGIPGRSSWRSGCDRAAARASTVDAELCGSSSSSSRTSSGPNRPPAPAPTCRSRPARHQHGLARALRHPLERVQQDQDLCVSPVQPVRPLEPQRRVAQTDGHPCGWTRRVSSVSGPAGALAGALDGRSALKDHRNGRIDAVAIANLGCGPGDLDRLTNRRSGRLGIGHAHGDRTGRVAGRDSMAITALVVPRAFGGPVAGADHGRRHDRRVRGAVDEPVEIAGRLGGQVAGQDVDPGRDRRAAADDHIEGRAHGPP
jgi:outer membrane protein assembly factor BamB